uniref:Uncharacterized protein n=1 Tax=Arundo donax TaxID=35708 RepID=A0A0A9CJM2_ARUDO
MRRTCSRLLVAATT